jgi:prephenate dehydratase
MRTAYLGPPGTFSEEALLRTAPEGTEPVPLRTLFDVVLAVQEGRAERALVPIESSTEGSVDVVLDALALDAPDVEIVGEVVLPVRHALLAAAPLELSAVTAVVSHPQALGQCARFLRAELPDAEVVSAPSTADAVRALGSPAGAALAAIGTVRAAELYGAVVLREGIEDNPDNATRFVWLAPVGAVAVEGATKASLAFSGPGAAEPGWLVRCLSEFAFRGVNLTRIESRPRRDRLGRYVFFVDLDGGADDERVAPAIEALRGHCEMVRVIGSFTAAETDRRGR